MLAEAELRGIEARERIRRIARRLGAQANHFIIFRRSTGLVALATQQLGFIEMRLRRIRRIGRGFRLGKIGIQVLRRLRIFALRELQRRRLAQRLAVVRIKHQNALVRIGGRFTIVIGLRGRRIIRQRRNIRRLRHPAAHHRIVMLAAAGFGEDTEIFLTQRAVIQRIRRRARIAHHIRIARIVGDDTGPCSFIRRCAGLGSARLHPFHLVRIQLAAPHIQQVLHLLRRRALILRELLENRHRIGLVLIVQQIKRDLALGRRAHAFAMRHLDFLRAGQLRAALTTFLRQLRIHLFPLAAALGGIGARIGQHRILATVIDQDIGVVQLLF